MATKRIGREFRFLTETGSTNRDADAAGAAGAAEGLLIAADTQTAARGRMGRGWFSPVGVNLYFSLVLRPDVAPSCAGSLPLVIGLAVAEALAECAPALQPKIKWPNDIYVSGRKICGILCEMQLKGGAIDYLIAGIGVNVNVTADQLPPELRASATSIAIEARAPLPRENVLAAILNRFEPLYDEWRAFGFKALAQQVNLLDLLRGKPVRMELSGIPAEGIACGIAPDGALLLKTAKGLAPVYSGEAHVTRVGSAV
ncbi:MAG: biotin--[acetyl-CoA-carboxylase] ligase [Kiritimatiellaeota bacterium]|nr:biotin--[acetyl-CoA-carboxylase] ligase [Kiritimatiellota bacterium]